MFGMGLVGDGVGGWEGVGRGGGVLSNEALPESTGFLPYPDASLEMTSQH